MDWNTEVAFYGCVHSKHLSQYYKFFWFLLMQHHKVHQISEPKEQAVISGKSTAETHLSGEQDEFCNYDNCTSH